MARSSTTRGSKSKRSYKWCGDGRIVDPEAFVNTTKAEVPVLCPNVGPNDYSDVVLERTIINFSIRRELTGQVDAFAAILAVQPVDQNDTSRPTQVLDTLSTIASEYSAKNILRWAALPVPANGHDGTIDRVTGEIITVLWDVPVKRRLDRTRDILTLSMNIDLDLAVSVFVQSRVLLSYGKR